MAIQREYKIISADSLDFLDGEMNEAADGGFVFVQLVVCGENYVATMVRESESGS